MKAIFLILAGVLLAAGLSAQKLVPKKQIEKASRNSLALQKQDFQSYASNVQERLGEIKQDLRQLDFIAKHEGSADRKLKSKVKSLKIEEKELEADLKNFIQYGVMEDWKIFRNEFNQDLSLILTDIASFNIEAEPAEWIAEKK
jgi:hypothetical protein